MTSIAPKPLSSTCILIGKAYRAVYKCARVALSDYDVLPAQFILLAALWEQDGQSGAELAQTLGLDSASMTGLIDRSVANGLIERRPHDKDRRINRIWLSDKGQKLEEEVGVAMVAFDNELAELIGGDAEPFNENLGRLAEIRVKDTTSNNRNRRKTYVAR